MKNQPKFEISVSIALKVPLFQYHIDILTVLAIQDQNLTDFWFQWLKRNNYFETTKKIEKTSDKSYFQFYKKKVVKTVDNVYN